MRRLCISLCGLLLSPACIMAQQQPAADPNAARLLDEIMTQWEKAMTGLNSVHTAVSRNTIKKTFQTVEKFSGEAKFLKTGPNQPCRASMYLVKDKLPEVFEKYICTGTYIFMYDPANKVLKYAEQQRAGHGQLGDNFMEFLFGMKKEDANKRYHFVYIPSDKNYHYLRILPRFKEDEKHFKEARVALNVSNFLPRQLWLLQANDDEVTWDFPRLFNTEIRPQEFENPATPTGWKVEKFQRDK